MATSSIGVPISVTVTTTPSLIWPGDITNIIGGAITNTGSTNIFLGYGFAPTTSSFSYVLLANIGYVEIFASAKFTGQVWAVVASGVGSCVVTEFRPAGWSPIRQA